MNSRLTLCLTLHIKEDKEFKNTNLETEGDKKFDVLNQYRTLESTERTINRKIVATIANNLWKNVLRTCIYRSMSIAVLTKMHNYQISTIRESQWSLLWWPFMFWPSIIVTIAMNYVISLLFQWTIVAIETNSYVCHYSDDYRGLKKNFPIFLIYLSTKN